VASSFIQKLILKVYAEGYTFDRIAANLLEEEINMGCNTDVTIVKPGYYIRKYKLSSWKHQRPLGFVVPPQCSHCFALQSVKYMRTGDFSLHIYCITCQTDTAWTTPDNFYLPSGVIKNQMTGWILMVCDDLVAPGEAIPGYLNSAIVEAAKASSSSLPKKKQGKKKDRLAIRQATEQLTKIAMDPGLDQDAEGEPDDEKSGDRVGAESQDVVHDAEMADAVTTTDQDDVPMEESGGSSDEWDDAKETEEASSSELSLERPVRKRRKASKQPTMDAGGAGGAKEAIVKKKEKGKGKEKHKDKKTAEQLVEKTTTAEQTMEQK
jgi:hypothetical protein